MSVLIHHRIIKSYLNIIYTSCLTIRQWKSICKYCSKWKNTVEFPECRTKDHCNSEQFQYRIYWNPTKNSTHRTDQMHGIEFIWTSRKNHEIAWQRRDWWHEFFKSMYNLFDNPFFIDLAYLERGVKRAFSYRFISRFYYRLYYLNIFSKYDKSLFNN